MALLSWLLVALHICFLSASAVPQPESAQAVGFAADPSINVAAIYSAAQKSAKEGKNVLATFPPRDGASKSVKILGDWENLNGVSAYHFIADMDVDCDGVDYQCPHNSDGDSETSFGHLDASKVPFYVLPAQFTEKVGGKIKPNALGAIICGGKMFYGIFGDTNGDTPTNVIGEASILLAQTCFPKDHLDGGNGHTPSDVAYIVFGSKVPSGVQDKTINISALKTLGDQQARLLVKALHA